MAHVVTITFNPCIDKNTTVDLVKPEKKLRCSKATFGPGGGGINVSRALKNLGMDSLAVYPAGGHTGRFLTELVKNEGIESATIQTDHFTRENLIVFEESTGHQFRFGMPGNEIDASYIDEILEVIKGLKADYMVVSGSLLPGMQPSLLSEVATIAKTKDCKLILDTSGEALKKAVEVGVFLLKPNLTELSSLAGKQEVEADEVDQIGSDIIDKGLCEVLVVSMGEKGALLMTKNQVVRAHSPSVEIVSTLGAGDSMVAGMVYSLANGDSLDQVLKYGIACGTAATITPGSELCRKEDVIRLMQKIDVQQQFR